MALRELSNYEKFLKFRLDGKFALPGDKKYVWFQPNPKEETFVNAEVVKGELDDMVLTIKNPEDGNVGDYKNGIQVFPRNPIKFDGIEDMAELSYLNEPSVLHNMRLRYNADIIHTYSGLFCVIVNPYKWITIYTQEMIDIYQGKRRGEVAPHVFAVADGAYRSLLQDKQNQSMLITGESGAGKTENTKKVIQYLATVAGRSGGSGSLEQQIIQANPILETFGNAKTNRNNNSSRFGKFIEIQFNDGGLINGASIVSYLLEKSRVVWQAQNERSFHVFYQLTKAATADEKSRWHITRPQDYGFINKSGCFDVRDIDDTKEYEATKKAMQIMNFTDEDIENSFAAAAGICHLGNVEFVAGRGESSTVKDRTAIQYAAEVFSVDAALLESGMIEPRIMAGGQMVKTAMNAQRAAHSRDALAKAVYGRLFLWIIKKINETIARARRSAFIGVLDIAGFEIFPFNTFEQLCINYTNEKLQQFFNNHMFKLEQEEYIREKINWTFIDFGMDSQATIDLIEGKAPPGVLALLDESCYTQSSDDRFLQKLLQTFGKAHPKFGTPRFSKTAFEIVHYAGRVAYETEGWIDKNKDPLQSDLLTCFSESKNQFVSKLFTDRSLAVAGQSGSATAGVKAGKAARGANFITVGAHHKEGLNSLMKTLYSTNPHFIRCILPNSKQQPGHIEDKVVLDQLRCNGVLEGIRISRKGFPNRVVYPEFVKRYYLMAPGVPRNAADTRAASEAILTHIKPKDYSDGPAMKPETPYRFGLTKVFFRAGTLAWIEEQREKKIGELIIDIQNSSRAWVARRQWKALREQTVAAKIIQQNLRAWLEFKNWPWWKLYQKARPLLKRRNFEKEIETRDEEIAKLKRELAERDATIKDLESQLKDAGKKIDDLTKKLEDEIARKEALEDELDNAEKQKNELQRQIQELQDDLADAQAFGNDLQRQRQELEKRLDDTNAKLADEQKERSALESLKKTHERELEEAASRQKAAQDSIARLEDQKSKLQQEVEEIAAASKDVQKALEAGRQKASRELAALDQDLKAAESREAELAKQKANLEKNLQDTQAKLEEELQARRAAESANAKTGDDLAAQKRATDSANETIAKNKEQIKNLQKERDDLQEQLRETEDAADANLRAKLKLQEELDQTNDVLERETNARKAAEKKNVSLESTVRELGDKLKESQAVADEQYVSLKRTREELDSAKKDIEGLEEKYNKLSKDKKALEGQLQAVTEERDDFGRKNKLLNNKVAELGGQVSAAEEKAAEAAANAEIAAALQKNQAQLAETKALLEVELTKNKKLEESKKQLKKEFDDLNSAFEDEQNARQAAERMKKKFEQEMEEQAERLQQAESAKQKAEAAAAKAKADARIPVGGGTLSEEDVKKYLDQIQVLREQLEAEAEAKNVLEKRRKAAETEAETYKHQLEDEVIAKDRSTKLRRQLEQEIEELKDQLEEAEEGKTDLEEEKRRKEIELEDLKKRLETEIEGRARAEAAKKDIEAELDDFRRGGDEAAKRNSEAERNARRLQGEVDDLNSRLEAEIKKSQKSDAQVKKLTRDLQETRKQMGLEATARAGESGSVFKLEEELDELRGKFDASEKSRVTLEAANKTLQQQLNETREQFDDENRNKTRLEKAKRILEQEIEDLRERLDEAEEAQQEAEEGRKKVELEMEDMRRSVEREGELRDQFEEASRKAERELADLRDRLAEEEVGRAAAERTKKKLESEVTDMSAQLDAEVKARQKIESTKKALETELRELRDKDKMNQGTLTRESDAVAKLNEQIKKLKAQLQEEIDARTAADSGKRRFQLENQNLSDEVARLEREVAKNKQELEELRKDKKALDEKIRVIFSK